MDSIVTFFLSIPFGGVLFHIFIIVFSLFFVGYSVLLIGQTTSLRKTVVTDMGGVIQFVSVLQLIIAIAILIISLIYW